MMELHLKETVKDMLNKLINVEDRYKEVKPHSQKQVQESSLRVHAASIKVVMNGMTAEKTHKIKEIMNIKAATIIVMITAIIIGIDMRTKTMEIITEGLIVKNSDMLKAEMKSVLTSMIAAIHTASAMKKQ
jgi:hypothetical protein